MRFSYLALLSSLIGSTPLLVAFSVAPQPWRLHRTRSAPTRVGPLFDAVVPQDYEKSTTQQKVRTMASYLVSQLLEKALLEATKEKSKISEEDAMALLETLQNLSTTKTAQDITSTVLQAADEVVESNGSVQEVFSSAPIDSVDLKTVPTDATVLSIANVEEADKDTPAASTPSQSKLKQKEQRDTVSSSTNEVFQRSLLAARIRQEATTAKRTIDEPQSAKHSLLTESIVTTPITPYPETLIPRIPDVISKDFGKPLEVTAWDVPPLESTSIPQKSQELNINETAAEISETRSEFIKEPTSIESDVLVNDDREGTVTRFPDNQLPTTEVLLPIADSADMSTDSLEPPEVATLVENNDLDGVSPNATSVAPVEPVVSAVSDEPVSTDDLVQQKEVANDRQRTVEPLREPMEAKTAESPIVDGDKYKDMSLEDKAFAILTDLGMTETRTQPLKASRIEAPVEKEKPTVENASTTISDVPEEEEVAVQEEEENDTKILTDLSSIVDGCITDERNSLLKEDEDNSENADGDAIGTGLRKRVVEPIRSFFSQPRSEPMFSRREDKATTSADQPVDRASTTDLPLSDQIREARKQPKSPEEEAKLAAKYANIADLGDRAFAILKDLGMV